MEFATDGEILSLWRQRCVLQYEKADNRKIRRCPCFAPIELSMCYPAWSGFLTLCPESDEGKLVRRMRVI